MNRKLKNKELEAYLKTLLGTNLRAFLNAETEPTTIRVNGLKSTATQIKKILEDYGYSYKQVAFNPNGFILDSDFLPLSHSLSFFQGLFQYQGISSQLPAIVLNAKPGERVLDMAAAPGSKSTQLAAMMGNKGILVLNDSSHRRLQGLQANLQRSGATNFYVLKNRGENLSRLYPEYFDKVLIDAPCTALGTLSSNREVYTWWSEDKLEKLTRLQYQLCVSAVKCLKAGGKMVYSTCSVAPEENELLINKVLKKFPLKIVAISKKNLELYDLGWTYYRGERIDVPTEKALRIWPHRHGLEGFFVIHLQKTSSMVSENVDKSVQWKETDPADRDQIRVILKNLSERWGIGQEIWKNYRYILTKERIWMINEEIHSVPLNNFISAGLLLGEKRLSGWKLSNASVQKLSEYITERRICLPDTLLKTLFSEGRVKIENLKEDYYVLEVKGRAVAMLYHEKGNLRIHLPHRFNKVRGS